MPSRKEKRLIIVHIEREDGFLKKRLLTFQYNKTGDYHEDMNAYVFEDYFKEMLKYLPASPVVVMERKLSLTTRRKDVNLRRKQEIIDWLTSKGIPFQANTIKKELQSIVNLHKHRFMKYAWRI